MIFLQLVISLAVPAGMVYIGRKNKRQLPAYGKKGFSYFSKRALCSPEAWNEANNLFASLLFASGINIGIISFVFFVIVAVLTGPSWVLCITLLLTQLAGSFVLITAVTESLLRRQYDESGALREEEDESDESDETPEMNESAESAVPEENNSEEPESGFE